MRGGSEGAGGHELERLAAEQHEAVGLALGLHVTPEARRVVEDLAGG